MTEEEGWARHRCPDCGIAFCIPTVISDLWRESKKIYACPNGHRLTFLGNTEAGQERDRLQKENARLTSRVAELLAQLAAAREVIQREKRIAADLQAEVDFLLKGKPAALPATLAPAALLPSERDNEPP